MIGPPVQLGPSLTDVESDLDKLFPRTDPETLPLADVPPSITLKMYDYQRQGLAWMLKREERRQLWDDDKRKADGDKAAASAESKDGESLFFWERKRERGEWVYYNKVTKQSMETAPELCRGGLLADDMGLGKCWAAGTRLMKANGKFIRVEKIRANDLLMGDDSTPRRVLPNLTHTRERRSVRSDVDQRGT